MVKRRHPKLYIFVADDILWFQRKADVEGRSTVWIMVEFFRAGPIGYESLRKDPRIVWSADARVSWWYVILGEVTVFVPGGVCGQADAARVVHGALEPVEANNPEQQHDKEQKDANV